MSAEEVYARVLALSVGRAQVCVITGGEPLLQNVVPLVRLLNRYALRVQIETAGTVWIPELDSVDLSIVCSPKTARVHPRLQAECYHFKYIVGADDIIENGRILSATQPGAVRPLALAMPEGRATIWIQPRDDQDEAKNAANLAFARDICLMYSYRLCLQLHKLAGVA
jgi:organic radical activating enzyme